MRIKAKPIAIGGITAALTFVLCMLGTLSVVGKILAPAVSGLLLILVAKYVSLGTAGAVYVLSSLVLFMLPNRLSTYAYILLLGYYPIVSGILSARPLWLRLPVKIVILTAVGCVTLFAGAAVLGLWENQQFVRWFPLLILGYYVYAAVYDVFIILLRRQIETKWDTKLRKILG